MAREAPSEPAAGITEKAAPRHGAGDPACPVPAAFRWPAEGELLDITRFLDNLKR